MAMACGLVPHLWQGHIATAMAVPTVSVQGHGSGKEPLSCHCCGKHTHCNGHGNSLLSFPLAVALATLQVPWLWQWLPFPLPWLWRMSYAYNGIGTPVARFVHTEMCSWHCSQGWLHIISYARLVRCRLDGGGCTYDWGECSLPGRTKTGWW